MRKTFPPFGNEFLPPSKTISLTGFPIIYPFKYKDICNYDHLFIMSNGLMLDDIIMNIIRNKKLERHNEEDDLFLQKLKTTTFICTGGHFKSFTGEKENMSVYMFHVYISILK